MNDNTEADGILICYGYDEVNSKSISISGNRNVVREYKRVVQIFLEFADENREDYKVCIVRHGIKNQLLAGHNETAVIAMLALAFPDLRWHVVPEKPHTNTDISDIPAAIGNPEKKEEENQQAPSKVGRQTVVNNDPINKCINYVIFDDIYDGTGLRTELKCEIKNTLNCKHSNREHLVVALDEEEDYAYFHAYIAYRFGYKAIPIVRFTEAKQLLHNNHKSCIPYLSMEDAYLKYPDQPDDRKELWKLQERQICFKQLNKSSPLHRNFITSGHHPGINQQFQNINKKYLDELRKNNVTVKIHRKPTNGMFGLWKKIELPRPKSNKSENNGTNQNPSPSHSAEGRVLLIAKTLIHRAERLRTTATSVKDFLRGATFATEAFEILDYLTPTTAVEALLVKHEFEVKAECAFIGVSYHFEVKARAKEIEKDVDLLAQSFVKQRQWEFRLHALVTIMNRLAQVFREAGRFEEEHECIVRMRRWHRQLVGLKVTNPFRLLTNGILWYAEFLLASFPVFILAILVWLGASSMAWWFIDGSWKAAISGVWSAFFSGTAAPDKSSWPLIGISCVVVTSGFFHLGVLVAYIYSLISRR